MTQQALAREVNPELVPVLIADDDPDDRMLACDALQECQVENELFLVEDGEDLLDFLKKRGRWTPPTAAPRPGLILLDLNMPRKNGWEALREIRADPSLSGIPVVVLTTSDAEEDRERTEALGADGFVTKPVTFEALVAVMQSIRNLWLTARRDASGAGTS